MLSGITAKIIQAVKALAGNNYHPRRREVSSRMVLFVCLFFIVSVIAVIPNIAHAQQQINLTEMIGDSIGGILLGILNSMISFIFWLIQAIYWLLMTYLIIPMLWAMLQVDASNIADTVRNGWTIVRDVANLFFILALIAIGIATILRIENYNYKRLLGTLVLMAVLVNFSLVIGLVVIQTADVVTKTFTGAFGDNPAELLFDKLAKLRGFDNILEEAQLRAELFTNSEHKTVSQFALTARYGFIMLFQLMILITFTVMAILLVVRVAALWALLILSPFAYVLAVLPATKRAMSSWWQAFLKYTFFAPIMAFFIYLVIMMAGQEKAFIDFRMISDESRFLTNIVQSNIALVVYLVLLWAGVMVARKLSVMGANSLTGGVTRLTKAGLALGYGRAMKAKTDASQRLLRTKDGRPPSTGRRALYAALNPTAIGRVYMERRAEKAGETRELATASGREIVDQVMTGGKVRIPHRALVERKRENEIVDQLKNLSKERFMEQAEAAETMGGEEGKRMRRAIVKAMATNGFMDDAMRTDHFSKKYADENGTYYNARVLNRFFHDYMKDDEQRFRLLDEDIEELGKNTGHWEYLGHASYDPNSRSYSRGFKSLGMKEVTRKVAELDEEGKVRKDDQGKIIYKEVKVHVEQLENDGQAEYEASEFRKQGGRDQARLAPHAINSQYTPLQDGVWVYNKEGQVADARWGHAKGELETDQQAIFGSMGYSVVREIQHIQERLFNMLTGKQYNDSIGAFKMDDDNELAMLEEYHRINPNLVNAMVGRNMGVKDPASNPGFRVIDSQGNVRVFGKPGDNKLADPVAKSLASQQSITDEKKVAAIAKGVNKYHNSGGQASNEEIMGEMYKSGNFNPNNPEDQHAVVDIVNNMRQTYNDERVTQMKPEMYMHRELKPGAMMKVADEIKRDLKDYLQRIPNTDLFNNKPNIQKVIKDSLKQMRQRDTGSFQTAGGKEIFHDGKGNFSEAEFDKYLDQLSKQLSDDLAAH